MHRLPFPGGPGDPLSMWGRGSRSDPLGKARKKHTDELIDEAMKGVSKFRSKVSVPLLRGRILGSVSRANFLICVGAVMAGLIDSLRGYFKRFIKQIAILGFLLVFLLLMPKGISQTAGKMGPNFLGNFSPNRYRIPSLLTLVFCAKV
ncbi:MAG: hypothetical protein CM15mP2_2190 [Methanobacteriota archaeon]|nr:MAG: hypothetical protein CM15mP2_2190 [Euryarchaeota archaeon]